VNSIKVQCRCTHAAGGHGDRYFTVTGSNIATSHEEYANQNSPTAHCMGGPTDRSDHYIGLGGKLFDIAFNGGATFNALAISPSLCVCVWSVSTIVTIATRVVRSFSFDDISRDRIAVQHDGYGWSEWTKRNEAQLKWSVTERNGTESICDIDIR